MGLQVLCGVHTEMPEEGHMVQDHVHMLIKIPPNFLVAEIIGYIKREECNSGSKAVWGKEEKEKDDVTGKDDGKF
jgi:REP element-mobilizing transposase RayT